MVYTRQGRKRGGAHNSKPSKKLKLKEAEKIKEKDDVRNIILQEDFNNLPKDQVAEVLESNIHIEKEQDCNSKLQESCGDVEADGANIMIDVGSNKKMKVRGPIVLEMVDPEAVERRDILTNGLGAPIGIYAQPFVSHIGKVVKNIISIRYNNWSEVPKEDVERCWHFLRMLYNIPQQNPLLIKWVDSKLKERFSQYKYNLYCKSKSEHGTMENMILNCPMNIELEDWEIFIKNRNTENFQELSNRNKKNMGNRESRHSIGRKSMHQLAEKLRSEAGESSKIYRVDLWKAAYDTKRDTASSRFNAEINKRIDEQITAGASVETGKNDVIAQVLGPDKKGRARLMGSTISPSLGYGKESYREELMATNVKLKEATFKLETTTSELRNMQKEVLDLRLEMQEMRQMLLEQLQNQTSVQSNTSEKMDNSHTSLLMDNSHTSLQKLDLHAIRPSSVHSNTAKKMEISHSSLQKPELLTIKQEPMFKKGKCQLMDEGKVVAYGEMISDNPSYPHKSKPIGSGNCLVYVTSMEIPDAKLYFQTEVEEVIRDVYGDCTIWPLTNIDFCFAKDVVDLEDGKYQCISSATKTEEGSGWPVIHEGTGITLTREIMKCLNPLHLLNDTVVDLYFALLKEKEQVGATNSNVKPMNHYFSSFFYNKLYQDKQKYNYDNVREFTKYDKLGYFLGSCALIFIPICKNKHWTLGVIDIKRKKVMHLDSMGNGDDDVISNLALYIVDEHHNKNHLHMDTKDWPKEEIKCPKQTDNIYDCGLYVLKYAGCLSKGCDLHFQQEDINYFRPRLQKLLPSLDIDY